MFKKYASAELLFKEAENMRLKPQWETSHGLFSIKQHNKSIYVFYTKLHINSQLGAWMSQDKYITHTILLKNNFPDIPYCYTTQIKNVNRFFDSNHPIVQKPVLGQKAENTYLIKTRDEIKNDSLDEWIFEKYIQGIEYRCLVLQGKVIAMQEKRLAPTTKYPWRKIFRTIEKQQWNKAMVKMSISISQLFHLGFLAVDFILDTNKNLWILETNSMPGLHSFHNPDEGQKLNIAKEVLLTIVND